MALTATSRTIRARLPRPFAMPPARLTSLIAAGVIAVGAMTAVTPVANAGTPEENCADVGGKLYTNANATGHIFQTCCYKDAEGKSGCDNYEDGRYTGTTAFKRQGPAPGPSGPPANNAPIEPPRPAA